MILLFYAYTLIPLSQAMAISFSTPLFIYFGGIFFLKENTDKQKTFYMLLGFVLTLVIIRPDLKLQIGSIIAIISSITHAIAGLIVKKLSETENVLTLIIWPNLNSSGLDTRNSPNELKPQSPIFFK